MCDNDSPPFKVGDKVVHKEHKHYGEMEVLSIFQHPIKGEYLVLYNGGLDTHLWPSDRYELVPDPMIARREAYITFASIIWPDWSKEGKQAVREGRVDKQVNKYYEAVIATKHLFT